jgi:putative phosphoribosyl transferase
LIDSDSKSKIRILSRSGEAFSDRKQAGELLATELTALKGKRAVVLGIPRGGLIVARAFAREIEADLDIVLSRKLGTPGHEELAMGALAESGEVFLNRNVVDELGIGQHQIDEEKGRQMAEIKRRSRLIRSVLPRVALQNRIVVVTDDGVATGATMQAAVWAIRHEKPQRLIAAIPVASEEAVNRLAQDVDELVCLRMPSYFMAVGQFYRRFDQTTDEEVLEILREEKDRKKGES